MEFFKKFFLQAATIFQNFKLILTETFHVLWTGISHTLVEVADFTKQTVADF